MRCLFLFVCSEAVSGLLAERRLQRSEELLSRDDGGINNSHNQIFLI